MKSLHFNISNTNNTSFKVQEDKMVAFYDKFHQHHEVQLTYIVKGRGTLLMEDYMGDYSAGDIFIIGSNAAHLFRSDVNASLPKDEIQSHSISVFFDPFFLGPKFLEVAETYNLAKWMSKTNRGLKVLQPASAEIAHLMSKIKEKEGLERLIIFLKILNILSESEDTIYLSKAGGSKLPSTNADSRLQQVMTFSYQEFHREIKLEEVANIVHLTVPAFCKYFKLHTRKTYVEFLNEIRISKACQLLRNKEFSVGQIADKVGFNNIANFNRRFKQINGQTPSAYRKQYLLGAGVF